MGLFNKAVCGLVLTGMLASCGASSKKSGVISANTILDNKALTDKEKAIKLTEAAEQLMSPAGITYAKLVIDQAIVLDPAYSKAKLYKNILDVQIPLKGLLARIKPLADSTPSGAAQLQSYVDGLPTSANKTYLLDGKGNIRTEAQLQKHMDVFHNSLDSLRTFLKDNKNEEYELQLIDWKRQAFLDPYDSSCILVSKPANTKGLPDFQIDARPECAATTIATKLNRVDIEGLIQAVTAQQLLAIGITAYDATGVASAADADNGNDVSDKEIYTMLSKSSAFGKLRGNQKLKNVMSFGAELVSATQLILNMQQEVCPTGVSGDAQNRPGYLIHSGLCLKDSDTVSSHTTLGDALVLADLILNRQAVDVQASSKTVKMLAPGDAYPVAPNSHRTQALLSAPLESPIKDIKTLLPQFNECDKLAQVSDGTVGGLFPNKDAESILKLGNSCP